MNAQLAALLACPVCHGELVPAEMELSCRQCARHFITQNGIPILLEHAEPIAIAPADHASNPLGAEFEAILASGQELVLHLGAGATTRKYPNCIELERKIFRHT